jgi:DNA-binding transcriptional regulator LsrR (DeoR family)
MNLARQLRQLLREKGLRDVVTVAVDEGTNDEAKVGRQLATACAAYFDRALHTSARDGKRTRVVLGSGELTKEILEEVKRLGDARLLQKKSLPGDVVWSPQFGHVSVVSDVDACVLVDQYRKYYGGRVETFKSGAVILQDSRAPLPEDDLALQNDLEAADLVLISAAAWTKKARLYNQTAIQTRYFPEPGGKAQAVVGVVFLKEDGSEEPGEFSVVGLGYDGLKDVVKRNRTVILVCGGSDRHEAALYALKAGFVSVLITTAQTADSVVKRLEAERRVQPIPPGEQKGGEAAA